MPRKQRPLRRVLISRATGLRYKPKGRPRRGSVRWYRAHMGNPQVKRAVAAAAALHRYQSSREYQAVAEQIAHRAGWRDSSTPGVRIRFAWVLAWTKCRRCHERRYPCYRWTRQVAFRGRSGRWVVRSHPQRRDTAPVLPPSSRPPSECRCDPLARGTPP